ncbi:MAG: hypothetical protein L6R37_002759 [Teloschistes peruensis]|nr:MAG: hypothetical protein L6R37_002759 [Teloschistes peruensis]
MDTSTNPMTSTSHPSLTHLSTTPLSPSYPLPPIPPSPTLPPTTPGSYISPTTLPPTITSLLSRSSSRIKLRSTAPSPSADNGPSTSRPTSRHHSRRATESRRSDGYDAESSWLTRTASALAMHALEEKGQGWLASRASATSLSPTMMMTTTRTTMRDDRYGLLPGGAAGDGAVESKIARSMPASRYGSRAQSRIQSRVPSRVGSRSGSRVELRMTSQLQFSPSPSSNQEAEAAPVPVSQDMETLEPDFVDLEDEPDDDDDDEGTEREEVVDESEMRRLVWGRVGGWVDWAVGWMDLSVDEGVEEGGEEEGGKAEMQEMGMEGSRGESDWIEEGEGLGIKAPRTGGVWEDAKWLFKVAGHSV